MLNDADRIFTNIYGWGDAGLKGAKARGDWDKTAKLLALGHDEIVERMKASGPSRARRRWISDRAEMVIHAKRGQRPSALSGGECR
jgi:hypothetical protein